MNNLREAAEAVGRELSGRHPFNEYHIQPKDLAGSLKEACSTCLAHKALREALDTPPDPEMVRRLAEIKCKWEILRTLDCPEDLDWLILQLETAWGIKKEE